MLRSVIGLLTGAAIGAGIFWFGGKFYQQHVIAPSGADATRPNDYAHFLAGDPVAALAGAPLAWTLVALVGGGAAVLISQKSWPGWVIGGLALGCVIVNTLAIPLPWWARASGVAGVALSAFLVTRFARQS